MIFTGLTKEIREELKQADVHRVDLQLLATSSPDGVFRIDGYIHIEILL